LLNDKTTGLRDEQPAPRDFNAGQPMIKELPLSRKFKSYVGLKSALSKLDKYLADFSFIDIATAEKQIDWNNVRGVLKIQIIVIAREERPKQSQH